MDGRLRTAAQEGQVHVLQWLLSRGADLMERSADGLTIVHLAAEEGHVPVIAWLETCGVDVKVRINSDGWTVAHSAAQEGQMHVLEWLNAKGADLTAKTSGGLTPALVARHSDQPDIADWLERQVQPL